MDYAVIKTGGKQYRVSLGDVIEVEKLAGKAGDTVTFSDVLMQKTDRNVTLGTPFIKDFMVTGKVVDQFKHDKIRVMKFKAKSRYRRTTGHRQALTRIMIEAFGGSKTPKTEGTKPKTEKASPAKAVAKVS